MINISSQEMAYKVALELNMYLVKFGELNLVIE